MVLVALAVSVPAVITSLVLGYQLDRQARMLFANGLAANLETFSLILQEIQTNSFEGLTRTAADNTLQVTVDLDIRPQLTKYLETQRQVLRMSFLGVYSRESRSIAFSGSEPDKQEGQWRLATAGAGEGGAQCVVTREVDQQLVSCGGTVYLVSVVPIVRAQEANLGDATTRPQTAGLLGWLMGGSPLANPALIASLQSRRIANPLIWVGDNLIYPQLANPKALLPERTDGSAAEYRMDQTAYLGAAKRATIGTQTLIYGLLEPLAPLRSTLQSSVLTVVGIGGLTIIATLAGVAFIATRLLSPIRQLREGAVRIGSGDLGQRIAVTTGDELETLADQFNDMAAKLQESYADLEKKIDLRTRELGQSVAELRALGEVSQTVNSTLDLQTVLSTIVFKAVQLSGTEAGAIYGFDAPSREFRLRATYGMSEAMIAALTKQGVEFRESTIAEATRQGTPVQISDLCEGPISPLHEIIVQAGYRALLAVPLLRPDGIVGALVVRRKEPGQFPKHAVDLLQTFAAQSVVAIQNAHLFSELAAARDAADQANRTKSSFLANMSHELRTPLNAIIGYSEILQENAADKGDEDPIDDLQKIESAGRHLLGLINNILDLSKIEAGKMDVFIEKVDIQTAINEVLSIVKPLADKSENVIEVICPAEIGSFRSDQTKVKQCLLNLLSNANKFTSKGTLTLAVAREGNSQVCLPRVGQRRRHDAGTARPAVPGVQPGGCLDHQALRRHGPRARHHQALLHHAWRRRDGREHARHRLDLHHQASGSGGCPGRRGVARANATGGGRARDRAGGRRRCERAQPAGQDAGEGGLSRHIGGQRRRGAGARARAQAAGDHARRADAADGWLGRAQGAQGRRRAARHPGDHGDRSQRARHGNPLGRCRFRDQASGPAASGGDPARALRGSEECLDPGRGR